MFDTNLQFRTTTDSLTATETSAAVEIGGTPAKGLAVVLEIPKKSIGDTLQLTILHSSDNSTYTTLVTAETVASETAASTVPFRIVRRFNTPLKYVKTVLAVAGTTPDFGVVKGRIGDNDLWQNVAVGPQTATP